MNQEPIRNAELEMKRAKLDRVLAAALAERTETLSLYEIATWLLYACMRSDAIMNAREMQEHDDRDEDNEPYWDSYTVDDEIEEQIDIAGDDWDSAVSHERDIRELGRQLDPDFEKPVLTLIDWLEESPPDSESAEVLRRVRR